MAQRMVLFSDLTGDQVEEDEHVSIVVKSHPTIDSEVRLDASASEVKALTDSDSDYVIVEIHSSGGVESRVVELSTFDSLFTGDPQEALEGAAPVEPVPEPEPRRRGRPPASAKAKSAPAKVTGSGLSKDELANVRLWAANNGHNVSARGRVPQAVLDAYTEAHKAS